MNLARRTVLRTIFSFLAFYEVKYVTYALMFLKLFLSVNTFLPTLPSTVDWCPGATALENSSR